VASIGLYNHKARYYDPQLARFISADNIEPKGPQELNRYAYVLNNPINNNDPTGHKCVKFASDHCIEEDTSEASIKLPNPQSSLPASNSDLSSLSLSPILTIPDLSSDTSISLPNNTRACNSIAPCISNRPGNPSWPIDGTVDPLDPDYWTLSLSLGSGWGGTVNFTSSRYGDVYFGAGPSYGKSLTGASGSFVAGHIGDPFDNYMPSREQTDDFFEGVSMNVTGGIIGGGGVTWSPGSRITNGFGYEAGFVWPQIGISLGFTVKAYTAR
jgi:RHS repeat-associated protein